MLKAVVAALSRSPPPSSPFTSYATIHDSANFHRVSIRVATFTKMASSSSSSPLPSLNIPNFVSVEGADVHSRTKPDGFRFSFVSYNILAQAYVKSSLFPHSPSPSLKWKFRSSSILEVLKNLGADFFCLQVDEFDSFYNGSMRNLGYSSIYMKRSGQKRDGCGLFYKHDRAELVLEEKIEYNDLVKSIKDGNSPKDDEESKGQPNKQEDAASNDGPKSNKEDRGDPNDPRVRLKRDCVGILAAFRVKDPSRHVVIVANTHLYWDPEWADVKLAQAKYLLSRLSQFKTLVSDQYECTPEVIVAGDFNSTPGDMVYQYLISGNSSSQIMPECLEEQPIPLCSVYASTRGEPPFTNYTPGFTGTLDYILFCPSDHMKPISFLELPDSDAVDIVGGLPNYSHPSDHLPIGAEFEIIKE
ncbi:carbon catabolite repressor protein 4 homolog 4 isoform X2 [Arachis ipaensis]|uniref:carbon catabolite repressor protein 4 homolog 4 isoform X2 n=1 Tax=Arachis ipaensis TaxID=130454 RepID=UPI0007AF1747|nr:carbon catabolite repressor protein 4 homolog 4 isoform X2 [Arachis ipaensis]